MRKASFSLMLAALTAVSMAVVSSALAQDSGVDQYLENPGPVQDKGDGGGAGSGGGGGGSGGGGGGGGGSGGGSGGGGSGGGVSVDQQGAAASDDTNGSVANPSGTAADSGEASDAKPSANLRNETSGAARQDAEKDSPDPTNPALSQVPGTSADDSGSGGIGIVLPIILGVLLLGAIAFAVVRRRRAKTAVA